MTNTARPLPQHHTVPTESQKQQAVEWFRHLRDQLCVTFESIEDELTGTEHADLPAGRFERKLWQRASDSSSKHLRDASSESGGGGEISIMHGRVFEKVGVNISVVHGSFAEEFRKQIPGTDADGKFWAAGISLVAHMRSPLVPAVHMNTRHIVTNFGWFGGGADLTPMFMESDETKVDTAKFHASLQTACDKRGPTYYPRFKEWCDEYFFLKHRNEPRGTGGIFYDYQDCGDWEKDFAFTQDVGRAFLETYPQIVRTRMNKNWNAEQREHQLMRRGRYVEFNLLYDRGTMFGLKTGGNIEAIMMSLPPAVKWS
ncbi:MAG TPA: oxygen-dependent coproporphyrinogen oxidase [Alphaproteobacteria bacterium]|nr:oxygen-dependent coproporphyrinogen oxidase [Alphaproteobacteria bacterium]